MHKKALLSAAACALLLGACGKHAPQVDPVVYAKEISDWRAGRLDRVAGPTGWTTLVGLYWLKPGANGFGGAAGNALQLAGAPAHIGLFTFDGKAVSFTPSHSAKVTSGGKPVTATLPLLTDADDKGPTPLESGSLNFYAIKRVDRYGVRVRDTQADARVHFKGLEYFPASQDWRFEARFEPYSPMKQVPIINILGMEEDMPSPGALVFEVDGKEYRLDAVIEEGETDYFVMFADQTSGKQTYGAGRFMYVKPPVDGKTVLDFNKSYNPPCTFSPYATCPLPPQQNRLPIAITAGELMYAGSGH
jgi:uncharacterized protein (DUF1684 family)